MSGERRAERQPMACPVGRGEDGRRGSRVRPRRAGAGRPRATETAREPTLRSVPATSPRYDRGEGRRRWRLDPARSRSGWRPRHPGATDGCTRTGFLGAEQNQGHVGGPSVLSRVLRGAASSPPTVGCGQTRKPARSTRSARHSAPIRGGATVWRPGAGVYDAVYETGQLGGRSATENQPNHAGWTSASAESLRSQT